MASWSEEPIDQGAVECGECRRLSDEAWHSWRAYREDSPGDEPAPLLVFACPDCAGQHFAL